MSKASCNHCGKPPIRPSATRAGAIGAVGFGCSATAGVTMDDADLVELWDERAAIIEFDGGRSRVNAERVAAIWIRREFGDLPAAIGEHLEEGRKHATD